MRVLVFSSTAWSVDNSFGNSFSNIFDGMDLKFANVYCRPEQPKNDFDMEFFQITEKQLVRNLRNRSIPSGVRVERQGTNAVELSGQEQKGFEKARKARWQILFWARDLLWKVGRWKSPELRQFLEEFQPDLIFQPIYFSGYLNDIAQYIHQQTGAPMIGYVTDDCYTLRQFRLSPLYWIDRIIKRRKVKRTIKQCDLLYVISQIQKKEYEKIFKVPCKVLTKCAEFEQMAPCRPEPKGTVKLLYAGNLGVGRWKSLGMVAKAVERLQAEGLSAQLDIYSATPLTGPMEKALCRQGSTCHGAVSYEQILKLQEEADVMLHVEDLSLKGRLAVHQSFSTKLVDFFSMGKCIFAVGPEDVASLDHLIRHDAAVTAASEQEVYEKLKMLLQQPQTILEYGKKAYDCGAKYHEKTKMQAMLMQDLNKSVKEQ